MSLNFIQVFREVQRRLHHHGPSLQHPRRQRPLQGPHPRASQPRRPQAGRHSQGDGEAVQGGRKAVEPRAQHDTGRIEVRAVSISSCYFIEFALNFAFTCFASSFTSHHLSAY